MTRKLNNMALRECLSLQYKAEELKRFHEREVLRYKTQSDALVQIAMKLLNMKNRDSLVVKKKSRKGA